MPRAKTRTSAIDTQAKRGKLAPRDEPYWEPLQRGAHLGYHKPRSGPGSWRIRVFVGRRYFKEVLAPAADLGIEPGSLVASRPALDYLGAKRRADTRTRQIAASAGRRAEPLREEPGAPDYAYRTASARTYTVLEMLLDHAKALRAEGKLTAARGIEREARTAVYEDLADLKVADVTSDQLAAWRERLSTSQPLRRGRVPPRLVPLPEDADSETRRKRKVRVNRVITDLKAARNRIGYRVDWLPPESARAFAKLKKYPGREVDRGRVRPLDSGEVVRLLDACDSPEFRDLMLGALVTGARYSELVDLRVGDFNSSLDKLEFRSTKDEPGGGRSIALAPEGVELFRRLSAKRPADEPLFVRPDGKPWQRTDQARPMRRAVERAALSCYPFRPSFHNLRDTYATTLLRAGVPIKVVSELLGHSTVALTERHYARFAEADLDTAARKLPRFASRPANVVAIKRGRRK